MVELSGALQQLAERAGSGDAEAVASIGARTADWQAELRRVIFHATALTAEL